MYPIKAVAAFIIVLISIFPVMAEAKDASKNKVLIIGLDGVTWDLLNPWMKGNKLPNIKNLIETGVSGNLTSVLPIISPAAWMSFSTGMMPINHGVFGYQQRNAKNYESYIPLSSNVKGRWFWEILGDSGKRSVVINVPGTYPPRDFNGIIVSGEVAVDVTTYPPELAKILNDKGYQVDGKGYVNTPKDEFLEDIYNVTDKRAEIGLNLFESEDWDLFVMVFTETDRIQHYLWEDMEKNDSKYGAEMLKYFQHIDKIVGNFLEKSDNNTTVFIVSDHGFGRLKKRFYVDTWLEGQGYVKIKNSDDTYLNRFKINLAAFLRSTGLSDVIRNLMIFFNSKPSSVGVPELPVDLDNSLAFSSGYYAPAIYINRNLVNDDEYGKLADELIVKLNDLKDPETGERVFVKVVKVKDVNDHAVADAPDIFLQSNDNYSVVGGIRYLKNFETGLRETGTHRLEGVLAVRGQGVKSGEVINNASLTDIAPTVLDLFGLRDFQFDGKVLKNIFKNH